MKKALVGLAAVVIVLILSAGIAGWWFMGRTTAIPDGAQYGPVTVVKDGYVSCYLVDVGSGMFALVDTCDDPSGSAIKQALAAKDATTDDVTTILVTHGHADHIGAARMFSKAQVFAHPDEQPLIEGKKQYQGTATSGSDRPTATVTGRMTHEQKIGVGNKLFESFHVPGHTPGSTILLVDGVLMLGDVGVARSEDEVVPPPEFFSDDPAKAAKSLGDIAKMLEGRRVETVLPSHSGPTTLEALKRYAETRGQ